MRATGQNSNNPAVRHHYVPKALLRPWLVGEQHNELIAYWWNHFTQQLDCKRGGVNSFGYQKHLLTLKSGQVAADALETVFFGRVDDRGAKIRDKIVKQQRLVLNSDERTDFARLLLSLESRRPENIIKLREEAEKTKNDLDSDPEILAAMAAAGLNERPSQLAEDELDYSFEDRAMLIIQRLVDNTKTGRRLINLHWQVKHLGPRDGKLILSDRPLVRIAGIDDPNTIWVLPLSPTCAFVACGNPHSGEWISKSTGRRFCKLLNVKSAGQADRFAFTVNEADAHWLGRYLRRPIDPNHKSKA